MLCGPIHPTSMIPPTSMSSKQIDSGALVSSLEVSRVSLGKSCDSQSRRAGLSAKRVHCSPNQLRCCKSPLCSRIEPTEEIQTFLECRITKLFLHYGNNLHKQLWCQILPLRKAVLYDWLLKCNSTVYTAE